MTDLNEDGQGRQVGQRQGKGKQFVQVEVVPPLHRVVRYKRDMVGNDLTATLAWCDTHQEPVWLYGDGSYTCPHEWIIEWNDGSHVLVAPPWETALNGGSAR
jgi:hypothetical protein